MTADRIFLFLSLLYCNVSMNVFEAQFVDEMMLHNGNCKYFVRRVNEYAWSDHCSVRMNADSMNKDMLKF